MLLVENLNTLLGAYKTGKAKDVLEDTAPLRKVQGFRRQLGRLMHAYDKGLAIKKLPPGEYLASVKIDGEFAVLIYDGTHCFTLNPGGTVRTGLPWMEEAAELLDKAGVKSAMIAGELYVARTDGARARVHDVVQVARAPKDAAALDTLRFAAFNVHEIDGKELNLSATETRDRLAQLFKGGERAHSVEFVEATDGKGILQLFDQWVEEGGAEGVVARSDSAGFYKIKPRHSLDLAVIGFTESIDDRAGLLHDMLLGVARGDNTFHLLGRVGGGFSEDDRATLLKKLQKMVVESEFVEVNSDRVAYQMVRPEWVVEINCLDLISRTTRGATVDKMVLNWNTEKSQWEGVRRLPLCSVLSPQFVRIRDDKSPTPEDVGIAQIADIVELPEADASPDDFKLPRSKILKRAVATKELKGGKMVRKLLMWKTNKEEEDPNYPAYVLHLTDFSPNRKAPLDHEIRVSSSEKQINELWNAFEKKYFIGGWEVVSRA